METFQILQSVTLEIPMKVNNDHQRETQYKKLMVYVIDKLNYFKQLNQGIDILLIFYINNLMRNFFE